MALGKPVQKCFIMLSRKARAYASTRTDELGLLGLYVLISQQQTRLGPIEFSSGCPQKKAGAATTVNNPVAPGFWLMAP